jgi:ABC-type polysaccharide/polyol phosphate transport system ATPase subunit
VASRVLLDPPRTGEQPRSSAGEQWVIRARDVSKAFKPRRERRSTIKDLLLHPLRTRPSARIEALRTLNFDVRRGEFVGVVGRNGSGKSTLLRCLAGIYPIDGGELDVRGRVAPFIELGVGFNPDLAARDNVVINAVMLGLSPREARRHYDEIIDFAELRRFADMKLKNFSSGMVVRLAFAVTVHVEADILLFDEVLSVGDAAFAQKCFDRFQQLKDEGRTVLLVTHEMGLVERFCDRALLLDQGALDADSDPVSVAQRYAELNATLGLSEAAGPPGARLSGGLGAGAAIRSAWFEDEEGRPLRVIEQGCHCRVCVEVAFSVTIDNPVVELAVRDRSRRVVFATGSGWAHGPSGSYGQGKTMVARVSFDNWLAPGRYSVAATVSSATGGLLDEAGDLAELNVYGPRTTGGVADLPHDFEIGPA